jgi:hypothetical protein
MAMRFLALFLGSTLLLIPADKKMPSMARGENLDLILSVTLYDDPALVKSLLSNDLEGHYIVADVKVDPKYGKDIIIDRDDFVLRTEKDGEKTTPFAASQITGKGALILTQTKGAPAASPGMVLGGPLVLRGPGLGAGGDAADAGQVKEAPKADAPQKPTQEDPLKKLLDDKILPEKKTSESVSGLLYFPMEKQKRKDLELDYGGRENRITLRFK